MIFSRFRQVFGCAIVLCCALDLNAQKIGDEYPNSEDILMKGIEYHDSGEYAKAAEEYSKIPEGDSLFVLAIYEKALSLSSDSLFEESYQTLQKIKDYRMNSRLDVLILEAANLDKLGRKDESKEIYNTLLNDYGHSNRGFYERSVLESDMGEYELAMKDLAESLQLNPMHTSTHVNIAVLAAEADQMALAVMALFFASLTIDDNPNLALSLLATIENLGNGLYEKSKTIPASVFDFASDLQDINEVIISKTAHSVKYKCKVKPDLLYMKILQVTCEMLKGREKPSNYILSFYMDFYQKIWAKNMFPGMAVQPLRLIDTPDTKKLYAKYKKPSMAFVDYAGTLLEEYNKEVYYMYNGKKETSSFLFQNSRVMGIGQMNEKNVGIGYWRFFHPNGEMSAEGELKNNLRNGLWKFYNDLGVMTSEENYKDNNIDGQVKLYYPTGLLKSEYVERNGKLVGTVKEYYEKGTPENEYTIEDGQLVGTYVLYDQSGYKNTESTVDKEKGITSIIVYNPDGSIDMDAPIVNSEIHGYVTHKFENGKTSAEGNMVKGEKSGTWKSYHLNGQLSAEGNYVADKLDGEWKYYDVAGRLMRTSEYKGDKLNGLTKEYDRKGKLLGEITYKSGRGIAYKYYDEAGNVMIENKSTGGKMKIQTLNELRYTASEGNIDREDWVGDWKFYHLNGALDSECSYEKSLKEGVETEYHPTGKKSGEAYYKKDLQQGLYRNYYVDGTVSEEGYTKDGSMHGPYKEYYGNGKLAEYTFFWNGRKNGKSYAYYPNGELYTETMYDNGVLLFLRSFDPSGSPIKTCYLDKGTGKYELYHINGNVDFTCESTSGYLNGTAFGYDPEGQVQTEVEWKFGLRHGKAIYKDNGIVTSEGSNYYGDQDGEWKYYDSDGKLTRKVNYFRGDLTGEYLIYHDNGSVYQKRNYYLDERDGEIIYYAEDGAMMIKMNYHHGVLISYTYLGKDGKEVKPIELKNETGKVTAFYQNGNKSFELEFLNGAYHGVFKTYFTNGKVREEYHYENDDTHGAYKEYYTNGQMRESGEYVRDNLNGLRKEFYDNGKVKSEVNYLEDKRHGAAKFFDKNGKVTKQGDYYYDEFYKK